MKIKLFGDTWEVTKAKHPKLGDGFEIDYAQMYDPPELSFAMMKELSDYFGTDSIDFDNYSYGGCESCDYGSRYGYKIEVYKATKNIPRF